MMKWIQRTPKVMPNETDSIIERIAKIRGIEDVNRFLNPTKDELLDPYLIKNIVEASEKILQYVKEGKRIVLSYDADADGLTSTSIMYRYLKNYTNNIDYIYNERNHGHGIHEQTRLDFIYEDDVDENGEIINEEKKYRYEMNKRNLEKISQADLLIIIDSSSNDVEACKKLIDDFGIEIIIIDHHAIEVENPHVLLVNPQQEGDEYPNKFLSGAGVVFKVLQVMEDILGDEGKVDPFDFMDLVAVGMYADVMRVDIYENRFMIMHGLRNIKNVGLLRILKGSKVDLWKIDASAIGFTIAPLLNGVARMDNIKLAIDILLTDSDDEAKKLRLKMHKLNESRKVLQKQIVEQYMTKIDETDKILLVLDEQSSKGFNGVVAQQLAQTYKRPAIVGRIHKGTVSGSFRSYGEFKLKSFLNQFAEDMNKADGNVNIEAIGHEGAGGFVFPEKYLPTLIEYIECNMPELSDTEPTIVYDVEIDISEVEEYIKPMEQFNMVTGNGFPKVITRVNGVLIQEVKTLGKTAETRKFNTFNNFELIKFKVDESYGEELEIYDTIDAVGELKMNEWYNFSKKEKVSIPQLILEDYIAV